MQWKPTPRPWELVLVNWREFKALNHGWWEILITHHMRKGIRKSTSFHWNGNVSEMTSSWPREVFTEISEPHPPSCKPDTEIQPFIVQRFMRRIVLTNPMMRILESIFMEYRSFCLLLFGFPFFFKSCLVENRYNAGNTDKQIMPFFHFLFHHTLREPWACMSCSNQIVFPPPVFLPYLRMHRLGEFRATLIK